MAAFPNSRPVSAFQHRQEIENEIERLIGVLDALDGDADREPWLASPENHSAIAGYYNGPAQGDQQHWARGSDDDAEEQAEELGFIAEAHGSPIWDSGFSPVIGGR